MEVYIDIYLLENIIINLFLLLLTFKILRLDYKKKNLYLSSLLGGIYAGYALELYKCKIHI